MLHGSGAIADTLGPLNLVFRCELEWNGQIQPNAACTFLESVYVATSENPDGYFQRSLLHEVDGFTADILFFQSVDNTPVQIYPGQHSTKMY